jgi:hypothetical protein
MVEITDVRQVHHLAQGKNAQQTDEDNGEPLHKREFFWIEETHLGVSQRSLSIFMPLEKSTPP